MRKRFEHQLDLRITPIPDIQLPIKCRDEMPPILRALQYIFITKTINEQIFTLLEENLCKGKKKTGRPGMDLWHVFVLAVVRQALDTNWDRLHYLANCDVCLRGILGVLPTTEEWDFEHQTIIDNVSILDETFLQKINDIVVAANHNLFKKKEQKKAEPLILKTDSYALETNVHFPTDLGLLWDANRKCLDKIAALRRLVNISGWRKIKNIRSALKAQFRATSYKVFKGKNEQQKIEFVKQYLLKSQQLAEKCNAVLTEELPAILTAKQQQKVAHILAELKMYKEYSIKFQEQIKRRLLKGETIPNEEKTFSIFEPHTEWITKGKLNKRVELGHLLLITTDQYQNIVDYKIMVGEKDAQQVASLVTRLEEKFKDRIIASISFDKGFWSATNFEILNNSVIEFIVLPKKGNHNKEDKARESNKKFKVLKNKHSAVESNINMLEHHGLNRCRDKGIEGFKRCVGLSIAAYNLHILGNQLTAIAQQKLLAKLQVKKAA